MAMATEVAERRRKGEKEGGEMEREERERTG
jgi:hypothetical protein